jgi:hypothetical protein
MIKYKIESHGIIRPKDWLNPLCKKLPSRFRITDIKPGMFSDSVVKRIKSATRHGARITLRKGNGYHIFISRINVKDQNNQKKKLINLKKIATRLSKSKDVLAYFNTISKIKTMDPYYVPTLLIKV